jgi:circadian clock protein KaiC
MDDSAVATQQPLLSTGVAGLDDVLGGGLLADRLYVIEGTPGAGKTTIALQFLMEGVRRGEHSAVFSVDEISREHV